MSQYTNELIAGFVSWFETYADSFKNGDKQLEDAVMLKTEHTLRVVDEMKNLCVSIAADEALTRHALIAALFHDIARFEQFQKYRTFSDSRSENHAEMGVAIINDKNLFSALDPGESTTIIEAIRFHNAATVPDSLTREQKRLCRLLRDADKLDIYKISLDYYVNPDPRRKDTVQVSIPDGNSVSGEVCDHVLTRRVVPYEKIKTVADFKMIQLGWIFDLNFRHSISCVKARGYIEAILRQLPETEMVKKVADALLHYIDEMLTDGKVEFEHE